MKNEERSLPPKLTKAQAHAFRRRWQLVNAREIEELRSMTMDVKWQQFNTLLRWAHEFGWAESLARGEAEVRERWIRLRNALRAKNG